MRIISGPTEQFKCENCGTVVGDIDCTDVHNESSRGLLEVRWKVRKYVTCPTCKCKIYISGWDYE